MSAQPQVTLPNAVKRQLRKANELVDQLYKDGKYVGPQELPAEPPAGTPPANGEPPAEPATPPAAPQVAAPPSQEGGGAATAEPPAPPAQQPAAAPPPTDWEQKFKVLQGKYNAEVPRLAARLRELESDLTGARTLLASLSTSTPPAQPAAAPPATPQKLVRDEEVREFGPDLIDIMRRVAREEGATLLPEIDRRVQPITQQVRQVEQTTQQVGERLARVDQQTVLQQLAQAVPNWAQVNEDPRFLDWLDQQDPYSGHPRGEMLAQAYKKHDGPRVVAFFTGFLKENAVVAPPAPPSAAAPPAQPQRTLEQMVAPGQQRTGTQGGAQQGSGKRVWTRAEIGNFYASLQSGKFKGTAAERKALEADIYAAQRENRIRG